MSLSLVQSRALLGLEAASVTVEVHLANGLPSFTLVGLAETEVKEARGPFQQSAVSNPRPHAAFDGPKLSVSEAPCGQTVSTLG